MSASSSQQSAASHLPALILRALAHDWKPITEPRAERFIGAALFADVSGFTRLTEQLAAQGEAGVEELTRRLNAYFGNLVNLVLDHGGDIVKFAGDALLALWVVPEDELSDAVLRAGHCGLVIQERLGHSAEGLTLRIAIGAGDLLGLHIGGERNRWEFTLAGSPLARVGKAQAHGEPGTVVLERSDFAHIAARAEGAEIGHDIIALRSIAQPLEARSLEIPVLGPECDEALWGYIPGAIRARLRGGQDVWLGELRRVTVLFANLPGQDRLSLEDSQTFMRSIQRILYRYEGSVNKLSVDDKGVSLVAALGLPPLAHEDDAARGVKVAIEMRARFEELGWQSAIGIATGRAFCGLVGSERRCEYTMIGDIVNLSARLMQAAPGTILCDEATFRAVGEQMSFEPLPPLRVKGKNLAVKVYRPRGQSPRTVRLRRKAMMVGRVRERAAIAQRLESFSRGTSQAILIEGDPGIGKSRLLEEAQRLAEVKATVLVGAADAVERATPYFAWRGVFAHVLGIDEITDPREQRRRVLEILDEDPALARRAPLLNSVLALELPETEELAGMIGEVRAENTHELLLAILRQAITRSPVVVTIEDAQWLDSASWTFARLVISELTPIGVILTTRPFGANPPQEYRALIERPGLCHIKLESLGREETTAFIRQKLGVEYLPEAVDSFVYQKAQGNPFFSEELAYSLRDTGFLVIEDGRGILTEEAKNLDSLKFPDTVQGIVTQRIDRLDPGQQLALKVASVIGRAFSYRLLRDIYPLVDERVRLEDALEALKRLDITTLETPKPNLTFLFKHIITQEVTYNLMLFSQRRQLHRAVAEWYEHTHAAEELSSFFELLAHHWSKAENWPRTVDYLESAGLQALRKHANEEAIGFFKEAGRLAADLPQSEDLARRRTNWESHLGEAYYALGNATESRAHLRLAATGLGYPPSAGLTGTIGRLLSGSLRQFFHRAAPRLMIGRGEAQREHLLLAARTYERFAQLSYLNNDTIGTVESGIRCLNLSEAAGPSAELARSYANMSIIAFLAGLDRLGQTYEQRALETAEQVDDPEGSAYVHEVTGIYRMGRGDQLAAVTMLKKGVEIAERRGDRRRWDECLYTLTILLYRLGEYETCIKECERIHLSGRRRQILQVQLWGLSGMTANLLARGERGPVLEGVVRELERLLTDHEEVEEIARTDLINAYGWLAAGQRELGQGGRAFAAAMRVAEVTAVTEVTSHHMLEGCAAAADVLIAAWEQERSGEAEAAARHLCRALGKYAAVYPIGRPHARLREGLLLRLDGKEQKAIAAFTRAIAEARPLPMPREEALAELALGRGTTVEPQRRRAHLEAARALFTRLGAARELGLIA